MLKKGLSILLIAAILISFLATIAVASEDELLLEYYTEKFESLTPIRFSAYKKSLVVLSHKNTFAFSEEYLNSVTVTTGSYREYVFDLGTANSGMYVISTFQRSTGGVTICSDETSVSSYRPYLRVTKKDGSVITLYPTADTYVRAGQHADKNYGQHYAMYVQHSVSNNGTTPIEAPSLGAYPYSTNSMRAYLAFDASVLAANVKNIKLHITAKCDNSADSQGITLEAMSACAKSWAEDTLTWNKLKAQQLLGHFAFDGVQGGWHWNRIQGTPNEWHYYNTRFYNLTALVASGTQDDLLLTKHLLLDFIADTSSSTSSWPQGHDIECANRAAEFPYIYAALLTNNLLTVDENKQILDWVQSEADYLYREGSGILFQGATAIPTGDGVMAYSNRGMWHLVGFYNYIMYFDHFSEREKWRDVFNARLDYVSKNLIHEDGSYCEITFGYAQGVINFISYLLNTMKLFAETSEIAVEFRNKTMKLINYLIACAYPNKITPAWGEGNPANVVHSINAIWDVLPESSSEDYQHLLWFRNASMGIEPSTSAEYDDIKVVTDRTSWKDDASMIFMNAKSGGNHLHTDALALLFYYNGRELLADTGMTSYSGNHPHFYWQRQNVDSHNSVEIDGVTGSAKGGDETQRVTATLDASANWGNIDIDANSELSVTRAWTTATLGFAHYRNVSFAKMLGDFLIVSDYIVPEDDAVHTYTQNWHSDPYANISIAQDTYLTGKTAFSTGPNLTIVQAKDESKSMSVATPVGYDATSTIDTNYFQYTQTLSGNASFQTVLYPTAQGVSADIKVTRLALNDIADDGAVALRIDIADSAEGDKTVYYFNRFNGDNMQDISFTREDGTIAHTVKTDAKNILLAENDRGELTQIAMMQGSELCIQEKGISFAATSIISDLSMHLDGTRAVLVSEDEDLAKSHTKFAIKSAETVNDVLLNGKSVEGVFTEDGFTSNASYFLYFDFMNTPNDQRRYALETYGGHAYDTDAWGYLASRVESVSIDNASGTMSVQTADTNMFYIEPATAQGKLSTLSLRFDPSRTQIIQMRFRMEGFTTAAQAARIQVGYFANGTISTSMPIAAAGSIPKEKILSGEYITLTLEVSEAFRSEALINTIRPIFYDLSGKGRVIFDYIYVGAYDSLPFEQALLFDFSNTQEAQDRYSSDTYGAINFDVGNWSYNDMRVSAISFDAQLGTMTISSTGEKMLYLHTSTEDDGLTGAPLAYHPQKNDVLQLRLRTEDLGSFNNAAEFQVGYYSNGEILTTLPIATTTVLPQELFSSENFVILTIALDATFTDNDIIQAIRPIFKNISGSGKIIIDYIYIGQRENLPAPQYTVTFQNANGDVLTTQTVHKGETVVYSGATPTKASDATNHYTFSSWDKGLSNITADTTITATFNAIAHSYIYSNVDATNHKATCSCGYSETVAHAWGSGSVTSQPTCTVTGVKTFACAVCNATRTETVAALGHSYVYIENGEKHTVTCEICDYNAEEDHSYVGGSCICGAVENTDPIPDPSLKFNMDIVAGAEMVVNYNFMASIVSKYEDFYLEVSKNVAGGEPIVTTFGVSEGHTPMGSMNHPATGAPLMYNAAYNGINAKEMGDSFATTLYAIDANGKVYRGETVVRSIKDFLLEKLEDSTSVPELKTMAVDMLKYGAAAQVNFGYDTENLVTDALTEDQLALGTQEAPEAVDYAKITGAGANVNTSITVNSKVELTLSCISAGQTNPAGVKCVITDSEGKILAELPTTNLAGVMYSAKYDNVGAKEMRNVISATFYNEAGEAISQTVHWSVESYVAQTRAKTTATETEIAVVNAMLTYGDSVAAYMTASGQ